jgi:GDPmannose 4,6-dehydratase
VAKLYAYWITVNYREAYNIFATNGILFNHESPIRGETFVTRKVTRAAARIAHGLDQKLFVGNINAERDWGHARDYVKGMWMIMQHDKPEDFVLATGKTWTVRYMCELAFRYAGFEIEWSGEKEQEKGLDKATGRVLIEVDPKYYRPTEVDLLIGNATKARELLGWEPECSFEDLIREMVESDLRDARMQATLQKNT